MYESVGLKRAPFQFIDGILMLDIGEEKKKHSIDIEDSGMYLLSKAPIAITAYRIDGSLSEACKIIRFQSPEYPER